MSGKWMRVDDGTLDWYVEWEREDEKTDVHRVMFEPGEGSARLYAVGNISGDCDAVITPEVARELGEALIRWADECQQSS